MNLLRPALGALLASTLCVAPALAAEQAPTLAGRALMPADASAPAPFPGIVDTAPAPAPGSTQPVGGFSALIAAPGRDTYWAMPDNGFGTKANSRSFLLRLYRVRADFKTARGGRGQVRVLDSIDLRDPDRRIPFALVNGDTRERLLTGGDFDVESVRQDPSGDLWFGEEFGPFLLHTDRRGKVLEAPIPLPGVKSPDYPADYRAPVDGAANLARSNGFEGMALSADGRRLLPVLEGPVAGDDPAVRRVYEFDIQRRRYTSARRTYRVADPSFLVSDFTVLDGERYVALERDNFEGPAARHKRAFVVDLQRERRGGGVVKREVADLLRISDPAGISLPGAPGDFGIGDPFAMPYVTIEAVLPLGANRLAIVNDTNFGGRGRNPNAPDPSDFIQIDVPRLSEPDRVPGQVTLAVIGDTPYGDDQVAEFPLLVDAVNRDPQVTGVLHLGDIKNGSSTCTDGRFTAVKALYEGFADSFAFTPGDNEWTDCHRAAAGSFDPLERLAALRRIFYPRPGFTLGQQPRRVQTQADDRGNAAFVENQLWRDRGVVFSLLHVVGSENDLLPWFGAAETPDQREARLEEFDRRQSANLAWLDRTFERAEAGGAPAVVIGMQADTFVPGASVTGFAPVVRRLATLARRFGKPVLLLQGDTHVYRTDSPLAAGSADYGIGRPVPNLTRVVVEGETADEWLRLTIDPDGGFGWTRERGF